MESDFVVAIEVNRCRGLGPLIRTTVAFGGRLLCAVGSSHFGTHGAHGSQKHINIAHFLEWKDCISYWRGKGYQIISISPKQCCGSYNTVPFERIAFNNKCLFIVGPQDQLSSEIVDLSDAVVSCKFPNQLLEGSVKYEAKLGMVLLYFTSSYPNRYEETSFKNEKYDLGSTEFISLGYEEFMEIKKMYKTMSREYANGDDVDNVVDDMGLLFGCDTDDIL